MCYFAVCKLLRWLTVVYISLLPWSSRAVFQPPLSFSWVITSLRELRVVSSQSLRAAPTLSSYVELRNVCSVTCTDAQSTLSTLSRVLSCLPCSSFVSYGISENRIGRLQRVHLLAYFSSYVKGYTLNTTRVAKFQRALVSVVSTVTIRVHRTNYHILCVCFRTAELLQATCLVIAASAIFLNCVVPDIVLAC
jgi:hypothetical protein